MSLIEPVAYSSVDAMLNNYQRINERLRPLPKLTNLAEEWRDKLPWYRPQVRLLLILDEAMLQQMEQASREAARYETPLDRILREVATKHEPVTVAQIKGPARGKGIMAARMEFYYRAVNETALSFPQIGRRCGDRDHTTILHGVGAYCKKHGLPLPRGAGARGAQWVRSTHGESR